MVMNNLVHNPNQKVKPTNSVLSGANKPTLTKLNQSGTGAPVNPNSWGALVSSEAKDSWNKMLEKPKGAIDPRTTDRPMDDSTPGVPVTPSQPTHPFITPTPVPQAPGGNAPAPTPETTTPANPPPTQTTPAPPGGNATNTPAPTAPAGNTSPSVTAPPVLPNAPTSTPYKAPDPFSFNYNYMNFDTARNQAEQRFNPLYEQAVKNIQAQQYQNEMDSGEMAAGRGIAQSGLAADALNKIKIASQGQIAQANTDRMSQVAALAQQMFERDQDRGDRLRQQAFSEYTNNRDFGYNMNRDSVNDSWRQTDFDYKKALDSWNVNRTIDRDKRSDFESDRGYNYQVGRDNIMDGRYTEERDYNRNYQSDRDKRSDFESDRGYNYQVGRDKIDDERYIDERDYTRGRNSEMDTRYYEERDYGRKYQAGRDKRDDFESDRSYNRGVLESDRGYNRGVLESDRSFNHQVSEDNRAESWRQKEWNEMSPAEQQAMMKDFSIWKQKNTISSKNNGASNAYNPANMTFQGIPMNQLVQNYLQSQGNSSKAPIDKYYESQEMKSNNKDVQKYFQPVSPAHNKNLTPWEINQMLGVKSNLDTNWDQLPSYEKVKLLEKYGIGSKK